MKVAVVLLSVLGVLLCLLGVPVDGETETKIVDRRRNALKFGSALQDYILFEPDMSPLANALTVCAWVKKLSSNTYSSWLSYATSSHNHEILISVDGYYNYFLESNLDLDSNINPSLGEWNHYCLTWSTTSNTQKVYFNGELVGQATVSSRTFGPDGVLFYGNERHYDGSLGGESFIFGGELFKVNFFAIELTADQVREMKDAGLCSDIEEKYGRIRYLRWEDLLLEERAGNVTEVDPGCPARQCEQKEEEGEETGKNETVCECKDRQEITKWDLLYIEDFYNQTLTDELLEHLRSYWDDLGHFIGTTISEAVITHFKIFYACSDQ